MVEAPRHPWRWTGWEPQGGNGRWAGGTLVFLSGHCGVAVPHGHIVHPSFLLTRTVQVHQTNKLQLSGRWSERTVKLRLVWYGSPPGAAFLTWKGRWRAPRRTLSTIQLPVLLLGACHTSSREPLSTTTSPRKPGQGHHHEWVILKPPPSM
jgi:hypothetical protein